MKIEDFGPAPRDDPLTYPGKRPDSSFLFCTDYMAEIKAERCLEESKVGVFTLEEILGQKGATPLKDRFMVVGYGSNANPAQLQSKFKGTRSVFPVIRGELKNYDIVYMNRFAKYGAIPATLTKSENTTVEIWASFLDKAQLEIMDESEGRGKMYELVQLPLVVTLENGENFAPVYTYASMGWILGNDGEPVRLAGIKSAQEKFTAMTQTQVREFVKGKVMRHINGPFDLEMPENVAKYNVVMRVELSIKADLGEFETVELQDKPVKVSNMARFPKFYS